MQENEMTAQKSFAATNDAVTLTDGWYTFKANNTSRYAQFNGERIIKATVNCLTDGVTYYVTKGDGNKYLNTLNRIFGPAMGKAMPVVLKVAFGAVGVLFVTALVLIYSDKRFGDGWGHAEAMAFMIQRATVILMWLVLVALLL